VLTTVAEPSRGPVAESACSSMLPPEPAEATRKVAVALPWRSRAEKLIQSSLLMKPRDWPPPSSEHCEGRSGGRWFERGADGSKCEWGRVLAYAPPTHVAVSWHLGPAFAYDPDPAHASRVVVTFHEEGGGRTRVDLVHSDLDRHGARVAHCARCDLG
jgi:hypothetical protein